MIYLSIQHGHTALFVSEDITITLCVRHCIFSPSSSIIFQLDLLIIDKDSRTCLTRNILRREREQEKERVGEERKRRMRDGEMEGKGEREGGGEEGKGENE